MYGMLITEKCAYVPNVMFGRGFDSPSNYLYGSECLGDPEGFLPRLTFTVMRHLFLFETQQYKSMFATG